ncbi:MAG: hypothetical protein J0I84_18195 [Terrimonas sp.]|nr:hypothetical protein [Terrimonas sp.]OJY88901.1 MAG: hypothetical protein BGP13_02470 [Sphingobacteriales bacterium 40-81]
MNNAFHISKEELELIDKYLNNHLYGDELAAFEQRLLEDTIWKQKVEEVKLISLSIQEAGLEKKLDAFRQELTAPEIAPVKNITWKKWMVAAAVIILMAVSTLLVLRKPEHERLYSAYYKPDPGLPVVMGEEAKSNYTLYDGMIDYKEGNYNKAIEKWKSIGDTNEYTDTLNYYIGVAALSAGDMEQAVLYLNKASAKTHSSYRQKAMWYLALIYIKQDNKTAAEKLLKNIHDIPEAKTLLKLIAR